MPICWCDACDAMFVTERAEPSEKPCPRCSGPLRATTAAVAATWLKALDPLDRSHAELPAKQVSPAESGEKGGEAEVIARDLSLPPEVLSSGPLFADREAEVLALLETARAARRQSAYLRTRYEQEAARYRGLRSGRV
jgi:hypothetical protein